MKYFPDWLEPITGTGNSIKECKKVIIKLLKSKGYKFVAERQMALL